jgi:hypothetical protein
MRGPRRRKRVLAVTGAREVTGVGATIVGVGAGVAAEAMIAEGAGAEVGATIGGVGAGAMTAETEGGVGVLGR